MNLIFLSVFCFGWHGFSVSSLDNGLALTPPMGWLTWERYRCNIDCVDYPEDCVNEALIKRMSRHLAEDGWLSKGYQYIIIDDCWSEVERDPETHQLVADKKRFPNGMKSLVEFVHSLGLKFGIYLDFGTRTCAGYPGSLDYLELDAETLADWKVDYVKMDGCYSDLTIQPFGYEQFSNFLNQTNRPIVFSCSYPAYQPWTDANHPLDWEKLKKNCNLWRMFDDIQDSWISVLEIVKYVERFDKLLADSAGPGHWNDPDMLIVGNYGLSPNQERAQFGMWAMLAAPLILSVDLGVLSPDTKKLLQNELLIRINQDRSGQQATFLGTMGKIKVWIRRLADFNNGWAVALLNLMDYSGGPFKLSISLDRLLSNSVHAKYISKISLSPKFVIIDAFSGNSFATVDLNEEFVVRINPTGIVVLIVKPNV